MPITQEEMGIGMTKTIPTVCNKFAIRCRLCCIKMLVKQPIKKRLIGFCYVFAIELGPDAYFLLFMITQ